MPKIYIRFGLIPENEVSCKYDSNGDVIKEEEGVSVYDAVEIDRIVRVVMPKRPAPTTALTLYQLYEKFCQRQKPETPILVVTGEEVGYGSDNEPLLKNVKIINELNPDFTLKEEF